MAPSYLNCAILPDLGHLRAGWWGVRTDIVRFFTNMGAESRAARIEVMRYCAPCSNAPSRGAIGPKHPGSPCKDIARYRRPPRGRLPGANDITRLGAVLHCLETEGPFRVASARLVLQAGCRPREIRRLRWRDTKTDRLTLIDAKFWIDGLRNAFITVPERELMLSCSPTKRLVNHARPQDVIEGYGVDWTVEQLRERDQRIADRIEILMNVGADRAQ